MTSVALPFQHEVEQGVETLDINELFGPITANDNYPRCERCDESFKPRHGKRFCSEKCRRRAESDRLDRYASAPVRACEQCGVEFRRRKDAKNAARFCSRDCGFAAKSNLREEQRVLPELRAKALVLATLHSVARCLCAACGSRFEGEALGDRYCSDNCRSEHRRARYIAANDNGRDRSPRPCAGCGEIFAPEYGDRRRMFCSPACVRLTDDYKARRKAAKLKRRGAVVENVNPIEVFQRDGWRCQLCGVKTPRKLRGTYDDRAPELDHIVPISKGGEHSYINTQCACRRCNGLKGDVPLGQMRLVG